MTLEVRLAGPADMPAVYALRHEVFVVGQDVPAELERDDRDETADHAIVLRDGEVVATGRLVAQPDGTGVVGRMAVAEPARGQGHGAAVLARLEQRAVERGLAQVELHAQVHACGFYERAGYAAYGEHYEEAGIEHVSMRKRLRSAVRPRDQREAAPSGGVPNGKCGSVEARAATHAPAQNQPARRSDG